MKQPDMAIFALYLFLLIAYSFLIFFVNSFLYT